MATKRTRFDKMNLGMPVHSDPYELENESTTSLERETSEKVMSHKDLVEKLHKEAKLTTPDFFAYDPSCSSDDSEDFEFLETIKERARRISFVRRRKLHYTEFSTVELARRLIREEFTESSESLLSVDDEHISEIGEEECPPCDSDTDDLLPYFQYDRPTDQSMISDDSLPKEDPEPGFHPAHHCFNKLMSQTPDPPMVYVSAEPEPQPEPPMEPRQEPEPEPEPETVPPPPAPEVIEKTSAEEEKHTRVLDHGENIDLKNLNAIQKNISSNVKKHSGQKTRNL
ncbi:translation initiation factor IF-2 [Drosophila mauritiana]|uniref:Translation initiation factor IF-2 n=1 Tax=Drosophila mauritiana TaxID=7226 RepID=A0A6P8K0H8_DROMA|nr:translation initiation factor IF-2 [Drosophila mauritiana]